MTSHPHRRPQVSLALMLLLTSIFAVMSAGMFYASRVDAVQADLSLIGGSVTPASMQSRRTAHLIFLMFTYTSPLLLAMLLGALVKVLQYRQRSAHAGRS